MSRTFFEILLLVPSALTAGFVLFVSSVVQRVMDIQDVVEFTEFLTRFVERALRSPYVITVSSLTFVGIVPYWMIYGLSNRWFSAGLVLWIITSILSKYTIIPVYVRITGLQITGFKNIQQIPQSDSDRFVVERRKLKRVNVIRSALSLVSVVIMIIGFYG